MMTTGLTPPAWAEALLKLVLPHDFESVAGDLLEEYRDRIVPQRGQSAADRWYARQVFGFVLRGTWLWGLLFGVADVARTAWDWLVPTTDFATRSALTTYTAVGLLLLAGFTAARRSRSWIAGPIAGVTTAVIGALISTAGGATLLAFKHDPDTLLAIQNSGGLSEFFTLPILITVLGLILGTVGGVLGRARIQAS